MPPRGNRIGFTGQFDDQVSGKLDRLRDKFDQLGRNAGAKAVLQGVGIAGGISAFNLLGRGIGAATDLIGDSIDAYSDLNETLSKSRVVFGTAAAGVEDFGDSAARGFGLSKQAAIEAAATYGNLFTGLDIAEDKAADMSTRLVALAGDLASFNNLDPTEVLDKLRSGLAGEAEPLRRLGVFLSEAKVKAKAAELGLADAHGELSEGAKVLARYQLILDETKTAQGDFARTADGAANSQRILNAEIADMEAEIGKRAIPAQMAWLKAQREFLGITSDYLDSLAAMDEAAKIFGEDTLVAFGPLQITNIRATRTEQEALARALQFSAQMADDHGDALAGARAQTVLMVTPTHDLGKEIADLASAADDARKDIGKLADELGDHLYGEAEAKGQRAETKKRIAELRDELAKTTSKRDATILGGQIAGLQQDLMDIDLAIAQMEGDEALTKLLQRWKTEFGKGDQKAQEYIAKLESLLGLLQRSKLLGAITFGGGLTFTGIPTQYKQHGGPVEAGHPYIVGERGPEVIVPKQDGWVIPNENVGWNGGTGGSPMGGGSPAIIQLVVDGRKLAELVDEHLYYARRG